MLMYYVLQLTTDNQFMGGVELLGGLLSLYRIHIISKKWYHKLLYHFFDIAVVKSWLLYRRDLKCLSIPEIEWMSFRSFKMSIANSLLMKDKRQRERTPGRPSTSRSEKDLSAKRKRGPAAPIPNNFIRLDSFTHWPSYMCDGKHDRCKLPGCNKVTRVICLKVNLCFTAKANCFRYFHTH